MQCIFFFMVSGIRTRTLHILYIIRRPCIYCSVYIITCKFICTALINFKYLLTCFQWLFYKIKRVYNDWNSYLIITSGLKISCTPREAWNFPFKGVLGPKQIFSQVWNDIERFSSATREFVEFMDYVCLRLYKDFFLWSRKKEKKSKDNYLVLLWLITTPWLLRIRWLTKWWLENVIYSAMTLIAMYIN